MTVLLLKKYSKKKKMIIFSILLIISVLIVYIIIDQLIFFMNKSDSIKFIKTYIQYTESVNNLPLDYDTCNINVQKKLIAEKEQEFNDFYERNYVLNNYNKERKVNLCEMYNIGMEKRLGKLGAIKKFKIKSVDVMSIYKVPFVSYITVTVAYDMTYEANGNISCFNGSSIFERQANSIKETYTESESIQVTFHLKLVNNGWRILEIPEFESKNN